MPTPQYTDYISKVTLPNGTTYHIKDSEARQWINDIAAGGLTFVVAWDGHSTPDVSKIPEGVTVTYDGETYTGTLVASTTTKPNIYLVHSDRSTIRDIYEEYVTVNFGTAAIPNYGWEVLGNTDISLDVLGALAWKDSASGQITVNTVDSASLSGYSNTTGTASYTPAGTVSVALTQTSTEAGVETSTYTPTGTVSKPNITVTPQTVSVYSKKTNGSVTSGSAASYTRGTFNGGSFTQGTDQFTAPEWSASVDNNETLSFSFSTGSFSQGSDSFTAATHGDDTFTANTPTVVTLPTFEEKTPLGSVSAALASAPTFSATNSASIVTGVTYDKATVDTASFTGTQAVISSSVSVPTTVTLTKTDKTVDVSVS